MSIIEMSEIHEHLNKLSKLKFSDKNISELINKVVEIHSTFLLTLSSLESIEDFIKDDESIGISTFESIFHIIDSTLNFWEIEEEDPRIKNYLIRSIDFIDRIFKYYKNIKTVYDSYLDFPIFGIEKIKEIVKFSDENSKLTELTDLLIKEIELKKERNKKTLFNDVNMLKIEMVKNLVYIKQNLTLIKEIKSKTYNMSA